MLQIASGKLFSKNVEQSNDLRGILYTNLQMFGREPVETTAGRLIPTSHFQGVRALVFQLTELIEDPKVSGGIVSHAIEPYLREIADVVSFAVNVTCTPDRDLAFRLISGNSGPLTDVPPRGLVQRVFDEQVWCKDEEVTSLVQIVDDLMGMDRKSHLAALRAIGTYVTGLHRLADDLEVAYIMLVASIESLAQEFDDYDTEWADIDETKANRIDQALAHVGDETAQLVRAAILDTEHAKLSRRFCEFSLDHLTPSFFREDVQGIDYPVGRADLQAALPQAYDLRSRYIHSLTDLPNLLTISVSTREVALIDGRMFMTFQGMTRLARHVITEFIRRSPKVEKEPYDYSRERHGIIHVPVAPKYWLWNPDSLSPSSGRKFLEGFLQQVAEQFRDDEKLAITDIREVLAKIQKMLGQMNLEQRRPYLAMYFLFNELALGEAPMNNYARIRGRYAAELQGPSVESALVHLLLGTVPDWPLTDHQQIHDSYFREIGRSNSLNVSPEFEAGLSLELAERYRTAGEIETALKLVTLAVDNFPGASRLRFLENEFDPSQPIDWRTLVFLTSSNDSASQT